MDDFITTVLNHAYKDSPPDPVKSTQGQLAAHSTTNPSASERKYVTPQGGHHRSHGMTSVINGKQESIPVGINGESQMETNYQSSFSSDQIKSAAQVDGDDSDSDMDNQIPPPPAAATQDLFGTWNVGGQSIDADSVSESSYSTSQDAQSENEMSPFPTALDGGSEITTDSRDSTSVTMGGENLEMDVDVVTKTELNRNKYKVIYIIFSLVVDISLNCSNIVDIALDVLQF